jgi:hypothetical protein
MELNIKNPSTRILLEKVDNGVILYEIGEDNVVTSKMVHALYYEDGIQDYIATGIFMMTFMESLKVPIEDAETNRRLNVVLTKIDPEKPMLGGEDQENETDDE